MKFYITNILFIKISIYLNTSIKNLLDEAFDFKTHLQSYLIEIDSETIKADYVYGNRIIKTEEHISVYR